MQSFAVHSPAELLASLLNKPENVPQLLFLCGPSGSGKTRWCLDLLNAAWRQKLDAAGVVSPAVFAQGEKTGIDLLDVQSGEKRLLAERGKNQKQWLELGMWSFDPDVLKWGNTLLASINAPSLLFIDEIGPLEFEQHKGLTAAFRLLDSRTYALACMTIRPTLLNTAREMWPWAAVHNLVENPGAE